MAPENPAPPRPARPRHLVLLIALAVLCVTVPFMGWQATWFGRRLTNQEIERYLRDNDHPRKIQHALSQISDRMLRGDPAVAAWYPQIASLARCPLAPIRNTAAWVMGQDNRSDAFHRALLGLLRDSDVMVRRNAALSLVRFGDSAGRPELVAILRPYTVRSPAAGTVEILVRAGQQVGAGTSLAHLTTNEKETIDVRSPFAGRAFDVDAAVRKPIAAGSPIASLSPESSQVWEALRALYIVGGTEDLPEVERQSRAAGGMPEEVRQQAALTAQAIRMRSERGPTR